MTMNILNYRPAPEDKCAELEDLLALLPTGKLSAEEESTVRAHAAACGRCQTRLAEYEALVNALHQFPQASAISRPFFTIDDIILSADLSDSDDDGDEESELATDGSAPAQVIPFAQRLQRRSRMFSGWGALAAMLLLTLLASELFLLRGTPNSTTRLLADGGTLTEYTLPAGGKRPVYIVSGPDGNVWFTETGKIGRITPDGRITQYPLPEAGDPNGMTIGPDGALWLVVNADILRMSMGGSFARFPLPMSFTRPLTAIVTASDGAIWFAEAGIPYPTAAAVSSAVIGRISRQGTLTSYHLGQNPNTTEYLIRSIAGSSDGRLWFNTDSSVGLIDPGGKVTRFSNTTNVPGDIHATTTVSPDGDLWFIGFAWPNEGANFGRVGYITSNGSIQSWMLPISEVNTSSVIPIALGLDGNLWAAGHGLILRIGRVGVIKAYELPGDVIPAHIVMGSDGDLWFTDTNANTIGRIHLGL